MSDRITEYVAALILEMGRGYEKGLVLFRDEIPEAIAGKYGIRLPAATIDLALDHIAGVSALDVIESPLTGDMFEIHTAVADYYFQLRDAPSSEVEQTFLELIKKYPVLHTYYRGGKKWVTRVVESLKNYDFENDPDLAGVTWGTIPEGVAIPASDRIVSLSHNQSEEIEQLSTELISEVEKENSIDGDTTLRAKILGQIRAGRELIRAGVFSIHLLQQTLLTTLGGLIEKYSGTVIGETARALLALLIQHVFT